MHGFVRRMGCALSAVALLPATLLSAAGEEGPRDAASRADVLRVTDGPTQDWPIKSNPAAKRVFHENYEDGTCGRIGEGSSAAVVSAKDGADVTAGNFCLRGNFDPNTTDPITRKQGKTKNAGLAWIRFTDADVTDELYVSFLWRLDRENTFTCDTGGAGADPAYKMAYIVGSATPWAEKVNYCVIQRGNASHWRVTNNSPNGAKARAYGVGGQTNAEGSRQGVWHRVELFLKLESTPGAADGVAVLRVDGKTCIDRRDVPYLWKDGERQTWGMMSLPCMFGGARGPKHSFGWQLDELEIWNGLPERKRDDAAAPR